MTDVKPDRRNEWFSVAAFSVIALVAITSEMEGDLGDQDKELKWSAIALIISLGVGGLAFFAHALGDRFSGTFIEGFLGLAVFGILAAAITTIMDPDHLIAQTEGGAIANANLYFFSWGALISALLVVMKFARDVYNVGAPADAKYASTLGWTGFSAAAFVVMAAATRLYKSMECDEDVPDALDDMCDRTKLAFALGAISGFVGLIWIFVGKLFPAMIDVVMACLALAAWCFGVGYITFGDDAPAKVLGNLYFSTWASFIMAIKLVGDAAGNVFGKVAGEGQEQPAAQEPKEEAPKEDKGGDEEVGEEGVDADDSA
jgi:hypothetical protein